MFAFALSLLVEVAFHGGFRRGKVASDDFWCETRPSREEVALDGIKEGAGTRTKSSGMKPLDQFLLGLGSEKGVGVMMGVVGVKRKAPKAVW